VVVFPQKHCPLIFWTISSHALHWIIFGSSDWRFVLTGDISSDTVVDVDALKRAVEKEVMWTKAMW